MRKHPKCLATKKNINKEFQERCVTGITRRRRSHRRLGT